MKLTSIPGLYRNLRRGREILAVLRRYGLADWLSRSSRLPMRNWIKDDTGVPLIQYSRPQRVRMAITELGPTFIKVGQVLAGRPDLVGIELSEELKTLREDVAPDTIEQVEATLAKELGEQFRDHFRSIDAEPLATASIGQVHRAVLADGRRVVLKVQRSGIDRKMQQDLDVLTGLAQLAAKVESVAVWGPTDLTRQLIPMILNELDFTRERQNLQRFAESLADGRERIVVPSVVASLCTRRVLVMDELVGTPLSDVLQNDSEIKLPADLGQRLAKTYLKMVFDDGLFHADPHPGNLILLDDGRLGILDFGMVGRIDEALRENIEEMLVAISAGDRRRLARLIRQSGQPRGEIDLSSLEIDVADFVDTFGSQSLDRFDLAGALNRLTDILHRHGIGLPNQSALLLKMLVSLEGTLRELGVGFDSLDIVGDFVRKIMIRRLTPARRLRQARRIYLESEAFLETAPEQLSAILNQARTGNLQIRLEPMRLPSVVNRLVIGLMASAVFLGSSLLLSYEVSPVLFPHGSTLGLEKLSVLGLTGLIASVSVMASLCLAIWRSR